MSFIITGPSVGQYTVILDEFEPLALQSLGRVSSHNYVIIDEIGKMENFRNDITMMLHRVHFVIFFLRVILFLFFSHKFLYIC